MDQERVVARRLLKSSKSIQFGHANGSIESFSSLLNDLPQETQHAAFKLLIEEEASLVLEYNALRALLKHVLTPPIKVDKNTLLNLVEEALNLSQILTKKYDLYINEHPGFLSKRALEKHQVSYKKWIESEGSGYTPMNEEAWEEWLSSLIHSIKESEPQELPQLTSVAFVKYKEKKQELANRPKIFPEPIFPKKTGRTWSEWFNSEVNTDRMNPRRLYLLRERRLLLLLVPVIKDFGHYSSWILWADVFMAPCLAYLNMVFFLPRLIFNLCTLFDNVFDENKMKPEAKHLGSFTRFMAQWNRLWPQLMNDFAWALSGALMCFVFIGAWQPLAIYLSVTMQLYDLVLITIRAGMDLTRLSQLTEQYNKVAQEGNLKELHLLYSLKLEAGIKRETSLLYLAIANAAVLFVAMCMALPMAVAISPLLPLVGAVMAVIMTVINFQGRSYLNTPESGTLENLLELGYPKCPVTKLRSNSVSQYSPMCQHNPFITNEKASQQFTGLIKPILMRACSTGNPPQMFVRNTFFRSQSGTSLHNLSHSPAPSENETQSMDDLDGYWIHSSG